MKKNWIGLCLILLAGCSSNTTPHVDETSQDTPKYADKQLSDTMYYNIAQNTHSLMRNTIEIEQGSLLSQNYLLKNETNEASDTGTYLIFYHEGYVEIVNSDPSATCEFDNPTGCTSYFEGADTPSNISFYKDQLYYIMTRINYENETTYQSLFSCDLDGSNRKEVMQFPYNAEDYAVNGSLTAMKTHHFHKDMFYTTFNHLFYQYNLQTQELNSITFNEEAMISAVYLYDDTAYLTIDSYIQDDILYQNALLKMDLNTLETTLLVSNVAIAFVDRGGFIGLDRVDGEAITYFQSFEDTNKQTLFHGYSPNVLVYNDVYIFDIVDYETNTTTISIITRDGELLSEHEVDANLYLSGVIDDVLHFSISEDYALTHYTIAIKDNILQKHEKVEFE